MTNFKKTSKEKVVDELKRTSDELMNEEFGDESFMVATSPPKFTVKIGRRKKHSEHYPKRIVQVRSRRNWVEGEVEDLSENGGGMALIYFPEPEMVDDEFDIRVGKTHYRIFVNKTLNKVWCNEIVSYNYKGILLLKNPIDKEMSERLEKVFVEGNLPKKNRLDTIAHFKQKVEKFYKREESKNQVKKSFVGNQEKIYLMRATLWCIRNQPKRLEDRKPVLLRAYRKFKKDAIGEKSNVTEESFVKMVIRKWDKLRKQYGTQSREFRSQNSLQIYAKSELKIPRNNTKQKVKENGKGFN